MELYHFLHEGLVEIANIQDMKKGCFQAFWLYNFSDLVGKIYQQKASVKAFAS